MKIRAGMLQRIGMLLLVLLLASCQIHSPKLMSAEDQINQTLSDSLDSNAARSGASDLKRKRNLRQMAKSLAPKISVNISDQQEQQNQDATHRFNVSVHEMPAREFFMHLVSETSHDIVVDKDVQGNISLILNQVTVHEAIQAACDAYGFQYLKTKYGYRIETKKLISRIYKVNYLNISRNGKSNMSVSPGNISDKVSGSGGTTTTTKSNVEASVVETDSKNDFWKKLNEALKNMVGDQDGRKVVVDAESGVIYVKAFPDEQRYVSQYLDKIQNVINKQVIIEAKILEVNLTAEYQSGIKWDLLGLSLDGTAQTSATPLELENFYSLRASSGTTFSMLMRLLNEQGRIGVLSSPHISTLNNQKAIIKVGGDRFFITNISSTTSGTAASEVTQDAEFTPFFSGVSLDVTPEINPDNTVTLQIHPVISTVESDERTFTISGKESQVPLAKSTIRESDSIVRAQSGQVIIIGGLMENSSKHNENTLPGLDQTPFKEAFGRHNRYSNKIELVILLKPVIVNSNRVWDDQLFNEKNNFEKMKNKYMYTIGVGHKKTT